jgi:deoxyribose-phosphate aldolase
MIYEDLAKMVDHSLLQPNLTEQEIINGCEIAIKYNVNLVMVRPFDVPMATEIVKGTDVGVASTVGFPHGVNLPEIKYHEANFAIVNGVKEIDMVLNIAQLKNGMYSKVEDEIKSIVNIANGKIVKVILENAYLTDEEKITACKISENAGAHYVKTSTGYAPSGATLEDVKLMKKSVSNKVLVKAAGGIRSLDSVLDYIEAGASRFGLTATAKILDDFISRQ